MTAGAPLNLHTIKYVSQEALDAQAKKQAEAHPPGSKKQAKRKQQQLDVSGLTTIGGNSPLALAIRHGHGAIVEYLLSQVGFCSGAFAVWLTVKSSGLASGGCLTGASACLGVRQGSASG